MNGYTDIESELEKVHGKVVCCFDGTGNGRSIKMSSTDERSTCIMVD